MMKRLMFFLFLFASSIDSISQSKKNLTVIAYYSAGPEKVDSLAAEKLTHIIFSFCHLKGNQLSVDNKKDSLTIQKLVGLKKRNPALKVMLSLGGWGGCETCSPVFSSDQNRKDFAQSVKRLNGYFKTDGIDLDWEYPAIEGYPGHAFKPEDKQNFTALVKELRHALGTDHEISFAAGGFQKFIDEAVEWNEVIQHLDRVNLMTYDLVNGYSPVTGHHTSLYSSAQQKESADNAVKKLLSLGVPANKLVIGAAFYARVWEDVGPVNNGLYQTGKFKTSIAFKDFDKEWKDETYKIFWDDSTKAAYMYDAAGKLFATFDDQRSVQLKTQYAIDHGLNGIMFWELSLDKYTNGLLHQIDEVKKASNKQKQ